MKKKTFFAQKTWSLLLLISTFCLFSFSPLGWTTPPRASDLFSLRPFFIEKNFFEALRAVHLARDVSIHKIYAPENSALKKARMFSSAPQLPHDGALKENGFVRIYATMEKEKAIRFATWLSRLRVHGIESACVADENNYALYVRFVQGKERELLYELLAHDISITTGLPVSVIAHVVSKESRWEEQAISYRGAVGLTQTLPVVIREILTLKKSAGTQESIQTKIAAVGQEMTHVQKGTAQYKQLVYERNNLKALSLIPDYVLDGRFSQENVSVTPDLKQKLRLTSGTLPRIELLALTHGPLNLIFGMVHLARSYNALRYYAARGTIDKETEFLLASQLAYNCGLHGTVRRLQGLGGWHNIFSLPEGARTTCLPRETADYGYQFIKTFLAHEHTCGRSYFTHQNRKLHLKICLEALSRSKEFACVIDTLHQKRMYAHEKMIRHELKRLVYKSAHEAIHKEDLLAYQKNLQALPAWPLVKAVRTYIGLLIENENLPATQSTRSEDTTSEMKKTITAFFS